MVSLSPAQCRAARALLDWQQQDLATRSKVSKKSIVEFERGRTTPWERTIDVLRAAFEAAGIQFLDAEKGVGGIGVRMREGFQEVTRIDQEESGRKGGSSGLETLGWEGDLDSDQSLHLTPPLNWDEETKSAQIEYWRGKPEKWGSLAEVSRQCLLRAMGVERL